MENYCAFSKKHHCIKWIDYSIARHELEEADLLCHENWIEIQRKTKYIEILQELLSKHQIEFPDEFD